MKKFSDFATDSTIMTGDKIKIDEMLGKDIKVTGYKVSSTKYPKSSDSKLLTIQFILDGMSRILFTGSSVLLDQCEKYKNELPFYTKIQKINKYYTFT